MSNSTFSWLYCGIIGLVIGNFIQSYQISAIRARITALEQKHTIHKPADMPKVSQRSIKQHSERRESP